ncbi:hypothetical protein MPSEU_000117300 [Mayamaea pseudoterrestris]|nr:hypothetical protein MPSEU_000117300 [Mayamaea pseudoterrestris]
MRIRLLLLLGCHKQLLVSARPPILDNQHQQQQSSFTDDKSSSTLPIASNNDNTNRNSQDERRMQSNNKDDNVVQYPLHHRTSQILATLSQAVQENRESLTRAGLTAQEFIGGESPVDNSEKGHCGCSLCDQTVWNALVSSSTTETCGSSVLALMESDGVSRRQACKSISSTYAVCSVCHADSCVATNDDGGSMNDDETASSTNTPTTSPTALATTITPTSAPTYDPALLAASHYCYPPYNHRTIYRNVWTQNMQVEVKQNDYVCDPGGNYFTNQTVSVDDSGSELTLEYKLIDNNWMASEVRVVLPNKQSFMYGTYSWHVKEIVTYDSETNEIYANYLDKDLVLGMFSWDDTENYTIHENFNHEVDIEVSRFGSAQTYDVQFLVQPPERGHYTRFNSAGASDGTTFDQANHTYEFTWQPTQMDWYTSAGAGTKYSYSTQKALAAGAEDRIQCLPANVEIRINLWNFKGAIAHSEYPSNTTVTQVVIDDFTFIPLNITGVNVGEVCSKDCQCNDGLVCGTSAVCAP